MELRSLFNILKISLYLGVLVLVGGCPRVAYVDLYNNTDMKLELNLAGLEESVRPGEHLKVRFTSSAFSIKSDLGLWSYTRNIPNSGMDGEFFDGTLTVQVETDGKIYVLRKGDKPPVQVSNYRQPEDYPLSP